MDWADLFPDLLTTCATVNQTSKGDTLCRIDYDKEYEMAIKVLDMVITTNEHSRHVLQLTDYIVNQCEGHYTAWSLRRRCLSSPTDLDSEMQWISRYTADCPKNYQLWQHRMHIFVAVMRAHDGDAERVGEELEEVAEELARNPKNYHAWQYRQWVISEYSVNVEKELELCKSMLKEDPFNNSVYNHLIFMHHRLSVPYATLNAIIEGLPENDSLNAFKQTLTTNIN